MLPAPFRLQRSHDFSETVRDGVRAGRPNLVVHIALTPAELAPTGASARAGLVVSKSVGGSVVRHAVTRRLRPLLARRLPALPADARVVVRALSPSAHASSDDLGRDLDSALARALARAQATS